MNELNQPDDDVKPNVSKPMLTKLTKWVKEPTLAELKLDLEEARNTQSSHKANLAKWLDNMNATGSAAIKSGEGRSKLVPRLIRKQAEWRYPALSEPFLSSEKLFDVSPVTWEDKKAAEQNMLVLNNQFDTKIDKTALIDEYVRTAVDEGTVILRTGWCFEEGKVEQEVPIYEAVVDPTAEQEFAPYAQMMQQDPDQFAQLPEEVRMSVQLSMQNQQPIRVTVTGTKKETVTKTIKNHPTVEVCDSRNVYIDPTCLGNLDKASFVIYAFETSLSELKRYGKYKNLENINVQSTAPLTTPGFTTESAEQSSFRFADEPRKKLVAHEYWGYRDIDNSGITEPIVATWVGDVLIRLEANPYPDKKLPFVVVQYLPVRKSIYGEPDGSLLEDNQRIQGAVMRGMIDLMGRSANAQIGMSKGLLDATNKRKYIRGEDYEFNPNTDPRAHIHQHVFPEIPQSAPFLLSMMNNEAESLTGVKAFSSGITGQSLGNSSTSAAGVRGALDAASKREMGILRRLANGIIQVGRKFTAMNAEFLEEEEVVRITNDQFVPVKRDDLAGNFDLKLSISTAEDDEAKAKELAFMLQTMGNTMDPGMSHRVLADIAKLRKMPELAHDIRNFKPQPDPAAEAMKEAQLDHQKAQTELLRAQAAEAMSKANIHQAKIPVEQARAADIQSRADNNNLKFMDDMTGTSHARALEKEQTKTDGQIATKVLDQEHDADMVKNKHNSDLLKLHATAALAPPESSESGEPKKESATVESGEPNG